MSSRLSWLQHTLISLALGGLIGCSSLANLGIAVPYLGEPPRSAIAQLPQAEPGSVVVIQGVVANYAPFLDSAAYSVQDESGSIWIRTSNPLPPTGTKVILKGTLNRESIQVASQELQEIYLVEVEQLQEAPAPTSDPPLKPKPKKDPTRDLFLPHKSYE